MVRKFGDKKSAWALGITGLVVAMPGISALSPLYLACVTAARVLHPGASVKIVLHPYSLPFTSFKKSPPTVVFHRWAGFLRFIVRAP